MIQLSDNEFRALAHCALRYALGRRTYIVSDVCDIIGRYAKHPALAHSQMAKEIMECITYRDIGDDCDRAQWMRLHDELLENGT